MFGRKTNKTEEKSMTETDGNHYATAVKDMKNSIRSAFLKDVSYRYYRILKRTVAGLGDDEIRKLAEERVNRITMLCYGWGLSPSSGDGWKLVVVPPDNDAYSVTEKRAEILRELRKRHAT